MTITLSPEAVEMLEDERQWLRYNEQMIREKIDRTFEQFERGASFSADASKADMQERRAAWLR